MKHAVLLLLLISNVAWASPLQCQNLFQSSALKSITATTRSALRAHQPIQTVRPTQAISNTLEPVRPKNNASAPGSDILRPDPPSSLNGRLIRDLDQPVRRSRVINEMIAKRLKGPVAGQSGDDRSTWRRLRDERLLVNQNSIPGRTELCATACAINVLQAVAVESGISPLPNPEATFERFVREHVPTGGASLGETVSRLRLLLDARFKERAPKVSATFLRGLNQDLKLFSEVSSLTLDDIRPEKNKLKLVVTAQFDAENNMLTQHAQIIGSVSGEEVRLIEPSAPNLDIIADVKGIHEVNGIPVPHIFYRGEQFAEIKSFVPVAIVTIEINPVEH